MLRGNIAATSLKMLLKNLYSVKSYDKLNMNVITLSLWENFWWGLIYFDQFSLVFIVLEVRDEMESKYSSIVFLSIYKNLHKIGGTHLQCVRN